MSRLEVLREQMNKVEKQYEKNKPLVNLVDNMVKLGALYRTESLQWNAGTMSSKDDLNRLHANQRNQEHLLITEDQNDWNKYNSRQIELHVSPMSEWNSFAQEMGQLMSGVGNDCSKKYSNYMSLMKYCKKNRTICICCNATKKTSKARWPN